MSCTPRNRSCYRHAIPKDFPRSLVLAIIIGYGALLRFDALTHTYGPVAEPRWLAALQQSRMGESLLRPAAMRWEPAPMFPHRDGTTSRYRSDPYTYLQYAREMNTFYGAHRREPLFPYAAKIGLRLLNGQDVAISFTSAAFSVLAIWATYLLGAVAFAPVVGLGAALLVAIEYDLITIGIEGWRDDAFMCAVLLTAHAMIRFSRDPTRAHAVILGFMAGGACLVRITALSFIIPCLVVVGLTMADRWNWRLSRLGLVVGVVALVVGPYLFNCWRAFGDPLYAINVHADVYRAAEGTGGTSASARDYLATHLRREPIRTVDTLAVGLTRYPFTNKWRGFDVWLPKLGVLLSWLAIGGLMLFAFSAEGRLLLTVLVTSLLPYAATWQLIADWRFTQHAYPFYLMAAGAVLYVPAMAALRVRRARRGEQWQPSRRTLAAWAAVPAIAALGWFLIARVMPGLSFQEALQAGEVATIRAGDRDTVFLGEWPELVSTGAVTARVAPGPRATVRMPLRAGVAYEVTARLDPATAPVLPGAPVPPVQALLNGRMIATCFTGSAPDRIGACRMVLPADAVRSGANRLTFAAADGASGGFRLWYLRIQRK